MTISPGRWPPWLSLALIMAVAMLARIALAPTHAYLPGGFLDERFWTAGMHTIHTRGFLGVFSPHDGVRLPQNPNVGYQWVLWLLSGIYSWTGGTYQDGDARLHLLVKAPAIAADMCLMLVVYRATREVGTSARTPNSSPGGASRFGRGERLALLAAAVIALQPAVAYDSAVWAQTDGLTSMAMLGATLHIARGRPAAGWAVWALGFSIKPLPVALVPVLASHTLLRDGCRGLVRGLTAASIIGAAIISPWVLHGDVLLVTRAFGSMVGSDYGRLSVSAWNTWWFADQAATLRPNDTVAIAPLLTYQLLGLALSAGAAGLAAGYTSTHRDLRGLLVAGAYMSFAFYMLPMSIHERYLFPVLALLLPVAVVDRRWMWIYAPASLTLFTNMFVIAPPIEAWSGRWVDAPFIPFVAGANAVMFAAYTLVVARGAAQSLPAAMSLVRRSYPFSRIGDRGAASDQAMGKAA